MSAHKNRFISSISNRLDACLCLVVCSCLCIFYLHLRSVSTCTGHMKLQANRDCLTLSFVFQSSSFPLYTQHLFFPLGLQRQTHVHAPSDNLLHGHKTFISYCTIKGLCGLRTEIRHMAGSRKEITDNRTTGSFRLTKSVAINTHDHKSKQVNCKVQIHKYTLCQNNVHRSTVVIINIKRWMVRCKSKIYTLSRYEL